MRLSDQVEVFFRFGRSYGSTIVYSFPISIPRAFVRDVGDGRALTFNYSADAVNYNDFTWVPVWINGQMKTVNKNVFSTSDVQSSGSNYIRFGDGTQICWYSINSDGSDYTWSFPVAFSNTEYSVVACPVSFLSFVCKDKKTTSCTVPGVTDTLCSGIAVGRWK